MSELCERRTPLTVSKARQMSIEDVFVSTGGRISAVTRFALIRLKFHSGSKLSNLALLVLRYPSTSVFQGAKYCRPWS